MSVGTVEKAKANRYQDNTQTAPLDRRRHLGFAPGCNAMVMTPLGSGQQSEFIPQGQLIIFKPKVERGVDPDWKPMQTEYSGQQFLDRVASRFQYGEHDWGFRALDMLDELDYDKETGWDEADAYFDIVHPTFESLGKTCESDLEVIEANINYDVAMPCQTCRLAFLNSDECRERMDSSGLDGEILDELRTRLIESYRAGAAFHRLKLGQTDSDIMGKSHGAPGKGTYTDADYVFAKNLHKQAPHLEQARAMAESARITGEAIGKNIGGNSDPLAGMSNAEKAEFYAWKAEKEAKAQKSPKVEVVTEVGAKPIEITSTGTGQDTLEIADDAPIAIGEVVKYDGGDAIIVSKHGGKYKLDVGFEKTVMAHRNEISQ